MLQEHVQVPVHVFSIRSKNVTIKREAYERLKSHKRTDESFSDVVLRLTDEKATDRMWASCGKYSAHTDEALTLAEEVRAEREQAAEEREDALFGR